MVVRSSQPAQDCQQSAGRFTNSSLGSDTVPDQVGFGLRLFTVVQITNLNVFLVAIILLAQLSKPFLQRKVEGLRFGYDRLNQF